MKPLIVCFVAILLLNISSFGQGSLTPAGAPAATMKTLDQVEARTPIDAVHTPGDGSSTFVVSQSGSYYLTGNITGVAGKNGIAITADNVTVDLNGFALLGVASAGKGIENAAGANRNLAIRNGTIRGWNVGVDAQASRNCQFVSLRLSDNLFTGLKGGDEAILTNCASFGNGNDGFLLGSRYVVTNCAAASNQRNGFFAFGGGVIVHCNFSQNGSGFAASGLSVPSGATITECAVTANSADGIFAMTGCALRNNVVQGNGGAGISCGSKNRLEGNVIEGNAVGISLASTGNVISANVVQGNNDNYDFVDGNELNLLLSQIPESIDWPASVKLAGSLTGVSGQNGITVTSDNVTIDLDGHALIGVAGSLDGVNVSGSRKNLVVRNGTVRSWAGDGVDAATCSNGRFEQLQLTDNTGGRGLHCGDRAIVNDCTARSNSSNGIAGGIVCEIHHCIVAGNTGIGIAVSETGLIESCALNNNIAGGISVSNWSVVRENTLDFHTTNPAILVTGMRNRIEANHLTRNQNGIQVTGTNNSIFRNSASGTSGSGTPSGSYNIIGASNDLGPVGTAASATSPWANLSF